MMPTTNGRTADQIGRTNNKQPETNKSRPCLRTDEATHTHTLVRWYPLRRRSGVTTRPTPTLKAMRRCVYTEYKMSTQDSTTTTNW
jgi:hypothetical protein